MQGSCKHVEKEHCKRMMIESKEARANKKGGREIAKHHHFDERAMNVFLMKLGL
jgi:hypothetical protein